MKPKEPITIWCLHGAVGMAADWQEFSQLATSLGYQVRAVDLWRFLDCCPKSLQEVGCALNAEVAACRGKHVIIGYSLGGRIALHALIDSPALWSAAVVISAHPGLATEAERGMRRATDAEWSTKALRDSWQNFINEWSSQIILKPAHTEHTNWLDKNLLVMRRKEIARSFIDWSLGAQSNLLALLPSISCPVAWFTGEYDTKFTDIARTTVPYIPQGSLQVIESAGHRVPWDQPAVFSQLVADFLATQVK